MELVPLCTLDLALADLQFVGDGPAGTRVIAEVLEGKVHGDRLSGHVKGLAGDWLVINGPVGVVDVRATIETDDGALVFASYGGRMDLSEGPGAKPFFVAPVFETGDERYRWLNVVQAVGRGVLDGSELHYDWFEVR